MNSLFIAKILLALSTISMLSVNNFFTEIGADHGKQYHKFTMTLYPLNASERVYACCANMKTMIIAITQAPESYANLSKLYDLVGVKDLLDIIIAGDLKVSNRWTGLSNHASCYPCAYFLSMSSSWSAAAPLRSVADKERNF